VAIGGAAGSGDGGGTGIGGSGAGGATAPAGGPVELDGVFNARHTGGLPAAAARRVRDRVLIRSGHLSDITATGCSELATLGVRTVVDLRETDGTTGVTDNPDAACVTTAASYLHAELPKLLPPSESVYLQILAAAEPHLGDIFAALGAEEGLPAVLHCVIGRDRANIVMALVLLSLGVPAAEVVLDFTTNQDPSVLADVQATWMQAIVDHVDGQGGIDAYLLAHGVTSEQLTALQQAALE
jgi:protein-tyrosine phosphatase